MDITGPLHPDERQWLKENMPVELAMINERAKVIQIPRPVEESLKRYVELRCRTGGFLYAVLVGDLYQAVARADDNNILALADIVRYIYDNLPLPIYGSQEKVEAWLNGTTKAN